MTLSTRINLAAAFGAALPGPGGGGGAFRAVTKAKFVDSVAGVNEAFKQGLLVPVSISSKAGSSNLVVTVDAEHQIVVTATAALGVGVSQTTTFNLNGDDGCVQPWSVTLTGNWIVGSITGTIYGNTGVGYVIAEITGVPPGSTPIWSGDSHLAIAGNETDGWDLIVAQSGAAFESVLSGTISAAGAGSGTVTVDVSDANVLRSADNDEPLTSAINGDILYSELGA